MKKKIVQVMTRSTGGRAIIVNITRHCSRHASALHAVNDGMMMMVVVSMMMTVVMRMMARGCSQYLICEIPDYLTLLPPARALDGSVYRVKGHHTKECSNVRGYRVPG